MPIVIKEIIVKTTVESSRTTTLDEQTVLHIKRMVIDELAGKAALRDNRHKAKR